MNRTMKLAALLSRSYTVCSVIILLAMLLFTHTWPSKVSDVCLLISILMLLMNVVNPLGLTGAVMILAGCIRHRVKEGRWPAWGVMLLAVEAMLAFVCGTAAVIVFVETTGGV